MAVKRYKDPDSGTEFSIEESVGSGVYGLTPIDKDAVDINGRPLEPKYDIHKGGTKAATDKKDG